MKNVFLKLLCPVLAISGSLFATQAVELEVKPVVPQYDHRMTVFHPGHIGYEFMPNNDLYVGVDAMVTGAYDVVSTLYAVPATLEARLGRTYFLNGQDHIRPIFGGMISRNLKVFEYGGYCTEFDQWVTLKRVKHPAIACGFVGVMLDHEFNSRLALGLNAKVLVGGLVGRVSEEQREMAGSKNVYYGVDVSLPFTVRMGSSRNWDLRLEPFALVMNSGERYLGHRSAIAYRF